MSGVSTIHAGASLGLPSPWADQTGTALKDASGRTVMSPSGAVFSASALGTERSAAPVYFRSNTGSISRMSLAWVGVGYSGKVVVIDSAGSVWLFNEAGEGWVKVANAVFASHVAGISFLYCDSRGYLYFASTVTSNSSLYRSTDDGANWSVVKAFPLTTDSAAPMCEDDLGNLYVGTYGSLGAGSNSCKLYKSSDGGANWTDISANMPSVPARHLHGAWWDNYRKLLFVTHGDAGSSSRIFVSDDRGATFSTWTASAQATAMAFSPNYIFYTGDSATDRGVYRVAGASTAAAVAASTPTRVFDWRADGGKSSSGGGPGGNGFAWWGGYENGVVFFPFGSEGIRCALLATYDEGATWSELDAVESGGYLYQEMCAVSPFNTGRDGWSYGRISSQSVLNRWGVFAPGTVCKIDPASTSYGSGVVSPRKEVIDFGFRSPGLIQRLDAAYTSPIMLSQYGVLLANGNQAGAQGSAPLVYHNADDVIAPSMTFAANPVSLNNSGTGSAVVTSTTQKYSGTNSFKAVVTAGTGNSQFYLTTPPWPTTDNTECWLSLRCYWNGTIDTTRQDIIDFNRIRVGVRSVSSVKTLQVFHTSLAAAINYTHSGDLVAIPENAWFRIKFACSLSPDATGGRKGRVRVWVDVGVGWRVVADIHGLFTYGTVSGNLLLGINQLSGGAAATCYLDDIKWSTSDPDRVAPITLAQSPSAVPDLGMFA